MEKALQDEGIAHAKEWGHEFWAFQTFPQVRGCGRSWYIRASH